MNIFNRRFLPQLQGCNRKWIVIAVLVFACLVAVNAGMDILLAPIVEERLGERLDARVEIEGFDFGWITGARTDRLIIRPNSRNGKSPADIVLANVEIDHHVVDLLTGKYRISRIGIETLEAEMIPGFIEWIISLGDRAGTPGDFPEIALARGMAEFDSPVLNRPLEVENVKISIWRPDTRRFRGAVSFDVGKSAIRMVFLAIPEEHFVETDLLVRNFDLSSLPEIHTANFSLEPAQLDATGVLEGKIRAFLNEPDQPPDISGELTLSGFNIRHPAIPLELTDGTARFHLAGNTVTLRDGDMNFAGGSIGIPAAGFQLGKSGIEQFWCRADIRNADIPTICELGCFRAVPKAYRPVVNSGTVAGAANIRWSPVQGFRYDADVTLRDVSGEAEQSGISVSALNAEGNVDSSGRVVLRNARGRVFGGRAEASGAFFISGHKLLERHLECSFTNITQDPVLIGLLPAHVRKALDFTDLRGAEADGAIAIDPDGIQLDITVHAASAELPKLPFRVSDATSTVKWASGTRKVFLNGFQGNIEGSPVEGSATLLLEKPVRADFILRGDYLPLDRELLDWLKFDLGKWKAGGRYDIVLQAEKWRPVKGSVVQSLEGLKAQADLREFFLFHPEYGHVAQNCFGNVSLGKNGFHLTNLRGDLYGIGFRGSGILPLAASGKRRYLQLESENIILGSRLYDRLPFDLDLEKFGLTGQCKLQGEIQDSAENGGFDANLTAVVHHMELLPDSARLTASGTAQVRLGGDNLRRPWLEGTINLDELSVGKLEGDRLSAEFGFSYPDLGFRDIDISAYGGKIASEQVTLNVETGKWETAAGISHLDFESLMGAFGVEGREAPAGVLRGDIELSGTRFDPEALTGKGEVKIDRGRLYSFSVLVAVLSVFDLQLPSQSPVTNAYGTFDIGKGRLRFEDLMFTGGSVPIHMEGKLGLKKGIDIKDQKLDLIVTVAKQEGLIDQIPLLDLIKAYTIDLLRSIVFQARVKGTWSDYTITTLTNPVVKPIQKMWSLLDKLTPSPPGKK